MSDGKSFSFNYIGDHLKELRKDAGWTQAQLIEHIHWHPEAVTSASHVSDIEVGRTLPSLEALAALSSAFGVGLAEFFGGVRFSLSPDEQRLIEAVRCKNMTRAVQHLAELSKPRQAQR